MKNGGKVTPLMQQYHDIKKQYADALLLFQVGDFYELFFDDAKKGASFLGIALTARGKNNGEPIPLCGVPVHAVDHYISRLIKGGFKVAICAQLEEAQPGRVVRRGVTRVLTPGTLTDSGLLDEKSPSHLCTFFPTDNQWGLLFGELLTAQLFATIVPAGSEKVVEAELSRFFPDEIVLPDLQSAKSFQQFFKKRGYAITPFVCDMDTSESDEKESISRWIDDRCTQQIKEVVSDNASLYSALYYFCAYMRRSQRESLSVFHKLQLYRPEDFLMLDSATQRNLELTRNVYDGGAKHTLFAVLDGASTAMGSRMIKKWIQRPLIDKMAIEQRQDVIKLCVSDTAFYHALRNDIKMLGDIERAIGRIVLDHAPLHDYITLKRALLIVPRIQQRIDTKAKEHKLLFVIMQYIDDCTDLYNLLESALYDGSDSGKIIKKGFDDRLDYLCDLVENSHTKIMELQAQEQKKTGITSLKISYNSINGYTIEVTKPNIARLLPYYERVQTLTTKERFSIPELKVLQHDIEHAKREIKDTESALFTRVKKEVCHYSTRLRKIAYALSTLDALLGLSTVAGDNNYVCPALNDSRDIVMSGLRHPVVEAVSEHAFIPNDICLTDTESTHIITGPNMGGKSTYLRSVALNCIMAHIGSFIAAESGSIGLRDRIFTRIGSGDNLAQGLSTFLVEMQETATICTQATGKSLVILDEVGRGTSTQDGLSIAQAVVEYITEKLQARCLFATHYHELTRLQEQMHGITCYYAQSRRSNDSILFLYKMVQGVADGSFGIDVAQLAQLPPEIINRSRQLSIHNADNVAVTLQPNATYTPALDRSKRVDQHDAIMKELQSIDCDTISPKQAFDLLWALKEQIKKQNT